MLVKLRYSFLVLLFCFSLFSCNNTTENLPETPTNTYNINKGNIEYNNKNLHLVGANTLQSFGVGSAALKTWNLDITREFIGNVKENPIEGSAILDANNKYLHALQTIVNENRKNNLITIICPFGWDGTQANLFTGKRPSNTFWWQEFKGVLAQWAMHFKDQNDVWLEVWNEPYRYDRADGYTDAIWQQEMAELYQVIRQTNSNIILVPVAEQGQDESVILNIGSTFLEDRQNVIFDIHAYEKWLLETATTNRNRLEALQAKNLPFLVGEISPINAGILMNPKPFLELLNEKQVTTLAWLWKFDETDQAALLTLNGLPNNNNNNNWGAIFKNMAAQTRD